MTAVTKYFFTPLYDPPSGWSVVKWWESRRLMYNLCVGAAGLVSLGVGSLFFGFPPVEVGLGAVVFGTLANVCYTSGSVVDLLLRKVLGGRAAALGPALFRHGFVFSVGLALLPIPMMAFGWLFRLFL